MPTFFVMPSGLVNIIYTIGGCYGSSTTRPGSEKRTTACRISALLGLLQSTLHGLWVLIYVGDAPADLDNHRPTVSAIWVLVLLVIELPHSLSSNHTRTDPLWWHVVCWLVYKKICAVQVCDGSGECHDHFPENEEALPVHTTRSIPARREDSA